MKAIAEGCAVVLIKMISVALCLSILLTLLIVAWVRHCVRKDAYPAAERHLSGEAFVSRDRCFIRYQRKELTEWCRSHHSVHKRIEVIVLNEW